jgi:hypothetical protein
VQKLKERQKKKDQLSDRKSAAAQQRMKNIASLASDAVVGQKRKRKGNGESIVIRIFRGLRLIPDDTFGADDADWLVYREIVCTFQTSIFLIIPNESHKRGRMTLMKKRKTNNSYKLSKPDF